MENAHTAIIDRQIFDRVQEMLGEKKRLDRPIQPRKNKEQRGQYENIYQKLLFCGDCGRKMKAVYYQSRMNGQRHYSYYCKAFYYQDKRRCSKKYINEVFLNDRLKEVFEQEIEKNGAKVKDFVAINNKNAEKLIQQYQVEIDTVEKEIMLRKKKANKFFTKYKDGKVSRAEYRTFCSERDKYNMFYKDRLTELHKKKKNVKKCAEEENCFLRKLLKTGEEIQLNRNLVEALVERINLYEDGKLEIMLTFQGGAPNEE